MFYIFQAKFEALILDRQLFQSTKQTLYALMAFTLPLNKAIIPLFIVAIALLWIVESSLVEKLKSLNNRLFYSSISLYVLYSIGLIYTTNKSAGAFDLQQKLVMFLFPLIFFSDKKIDSSLLRKVLTHFVWGCLIASILCVLNATYHYYLSGQRGAFFYVEFSAIMHPSYFAMYCVFAIAIILLKQDVFNGLIQKLSATFFLTIIIVLISSKSGFLSLMLVFMAKFTHLLFVEKKYLISLISFILFLSSLFIVVRYFPQGVERIKGMVISLKSSKEGLDTTTSRIAIWKHSIELLAKNYLIGVGTGDANDELNKTYTSSIEWHMKEKKFNAHNQYLQTSLAIGVFGLIALILPYLILILKSLKEHNYLYIVFCIIVLLNFLFESMLETQAGVIFILFFLYLFLSTTNLFKVDKSLE